jgi:hypothetical protein
MQNDEPRKEKAEHPTALELALRTLSSVMKKALKPIGRPPL